MGKMLTSPGVNDRSAASPLRADERALVARLLPELLDELNAIGRDPAGGWTRLAWTAEDAAAGRWFERRAHAFGLEPSVDRNGNRWAWSAPPRAGAIVTGSHLDTVPRGGRLDGALGVAAGLLAVHLLVRRGVAARPLAVAAFADEEGGRFDTPLLGSRLLTGALDAAAVLDRADAGGTTLREALRDAGVDPHGLGRDDAALERVGAFVELHVEQGRALAALDRPLGLATAIVPHGRWRIELRGEANHGGTTPLAQRRDPMPVLAEAIRAGREAAERHGALVTIGKLRVAPNASNAVAERVEAWLDVRAEQAAALDAIVADVERRVAEQAAAQGVELALTCESRVGTLTFAPALRATIAETLAAAGLDAPPLTTAAGHDAGVLSTRVPAAMLFVRNPTGVSHSPAEHAEPADLAAGVAALVAVLGRLAAEGPPAEAGEAR